jgi:hypothetical protein
MRAVVDGEALRAVVDDEAPRAAVESEALRAVHASLESVLAGHSDVRPYWGPELAGDDSAVAAALHAAGASWEWVALGFAGRSFWDLHVGILPAGPGYTVGLHWTSAVDHEVRSWAQAAVPGGALQFAAVAGEHQLLGSDADGITVHSAQSAVEAALGIASRVLRASAGDGPLG